MKTIGDVIWAILFGILAIPICILALCVGAVVLLIAFPFLLVGAVKQSMEEEEETRRLIQYGNSLCRSLRDKI